MIDKIDIVRRSKVRRAKLYYIRDKVSREMRRQLRKMSLVSLTTGSDREMAEATATAEAKALEDAAAAEAVIASEQAALADAAANDNAPIEAALPETPEEKEAAKEVA